MKVNIQEYENQRKEKMIQSNHYIKAEIVISKDDFCEPYTRIELKNVSSKEVAALILVLERIAEQIKRKDPSANLISKLLDSDTQTFSYDKETKEVEIDDIN